MSFYGPDAAILAAYQAHESASSPKTPSMGQAGRDYADRCANLKKCGRRGTRIETLGKMGALVMRCSRCGTPWEWTEAYILAGQAHSGRGGRPPSALERTAELCVIVAALERTSALAAGEAEIYITWLIVGSKSIEALARVAARQRFAGRDWAPRDVRRAIARSRRWLSAELDRRGLLSEPDRIGRRIGGKNA